MFLGKYQYEFHYWKITTNRKICSKIFQPAQKLLVLREKQFIHFETIFQITSTCIFEHFAWIFILQASVKKNSLKPKVCSILNLWSLYGSKDCIKIKDCFNLHLLNQQLWNRFDFYNSHFSSTYLRKIILLNTVSLTASNLSYSYAYYTPCSSSHHSRDTLLIQMGVVLTDDTAFTRSPLSLSPK